MKILNNTLKEYENLEYALSQSSILSRTDARGTISRVNENFVRISGFSQDELVGENHNIVNSNYHSRAFWIDFWKTISSGKSWRGEVCNKAKNGSLYWVDTFVYPFVSKSGKPKEYFSIRNDITEKKKIESDILFQNNILTNIAWRQSHEIRRPVASILGLIQLMNDHPNPEILNRLNQCANELDMLIKSIVRLTEVGEFKLPDTGDDSSIKLFAHTPSSSAIWDKKIA
jgi:PAS domain S-box-containing protein